MTLTELSSPSQVEEFLNGNSEGCVITFSATWCGPCKRSKPQLQELAETAFSSFPVGYVHEEDLEDFLDVFVKITAFPTYILFVEGQERARVEGLNLDAVQQMIQEHTTRGDHKAATK